MTVFSPVALAILSDLGDRDTAWYAHNILVDTVPKILSIAPYLNNVEVAAIRGEADKNRGVAVVVDIALTAHCKHMRVCRHHKHP